MNESNWERQTIEKIAISALQEQKRARNWGIFFKTLTFIYLFLLLFLAMNWIGPSSSTTAHTALIEINGLIGVGGDVTADSTVSSLRAAFEDEQTKGVILRINSPGGSPVQAGIINDEIQRLRQANPDIPLYAVVADVCASGGYYIAVAADRIYVDKASIVGSIGVVMGGFGFTDAMEKLGVERRLMTAGSNKGFLDPFSPLSLEHKEYAQNMLNQIHQQFIDVVRNGRGQRLKETPETFSGLLWTGSESIKMGLVDAIGNADFVAREVIEEENIVDFTLREGLADRFAKKLGTAISQTIISKDFHLK